MESRRRNRAYWYRGGPEIAGVGSIPDRSQYRSRAADGGCAVQLEDHRTLPLLAGDRTALTSAASALGYAGQIIVERGIGDAGAFGVADCGGRFGGQRGYGKGHGDTVIAAGFDFGSTQFSGAATGDSQAVRTLFDGGSHAAQVFGKGGDAVAFFYAEFGSVANFDSFFSERTEGSQHRKLVN